MNNFLNPTKQPRTTFMLTLPAAIAVSVIAYLFIGAEGPTWAGPVLDRVLVAQVALNLCYFLFLRRQKRRFLFFAINAVFLILFVPVVFVSAMSCFPGTGGRHGNCGFGYVNALAAVNFIVVFALNLNIVPAFLAALVLAFPVVSVAAHIYIAAPLYAELRFANLSATCYFQADRTGSARITAPSDFDPGLFIGEHAPRLYKVADGKVHRWYYVARKFDGWPIEVMPDACK